MTRLQRASLLIEPVLTGLVALWMIRTGARAAAAGTWFAVLPLSLGALAGLWCAVATLRNLRAAKVPETPDGPGVVMAEEGRIAYLGPFAGGAVAVAMLTEVRLRGLPAGTAWVLRDTEGTVLVIPDSARGAGDLVDALAPLPGFNSLAVLATAARPLRGDRVVWRRGAPPEALEHTG